MTEAKPAPRFRRERRTRAEAIAVLRARYRQQCENFPITRNIPESLYVMQNLADTIKGPWVEIGR